VFFPSPSPVPEVLFLVLTSYFSPIERVDAAFRQGETTPPGPRLFNFPAGDFLICNCPLFVRLGQSFAVLFCGVVSKRVRPFPTFTPPPLRRGVRLLASLAAA